MKIILNLLVISLIQFATSCIKEPCDSKCNTDGVIKQASDLAVTCPGMYIVAVSGTTYQPIGTNNLLNGFQSGDKIKFGFEQVFLGMRSCGDVVTIKLTCVEKKKKSEK